MANLLLIESPGKLRKLSQILGSGWIVKASMGHVRELANDGEDALGFDLGDRQIDCRYEPRGSRGKQVLGELRQAVKQAEQVYIATDPDREGETIGWHLQQALKLKNPHRVTYTEITAPAVRAAIAQPRPLNQALIAAGRARDCLDKLVGYKGSKHIVWKLNNGAKSMGRVQSATLHLICQREQEILRFVPQTYWSVWVEYAEGFKAFYRSSPDSKPATNPSKSRRDNPTVAHANAETSASETIAPETASDAPDEKQVPESDRVTSQEAADQLVAIARSHPHQVLRLEGKTTSQAPPPPFITSSLQQSAGTKLRLSPEQTMKVAQTLYEAGHITYMRTDSVHLADTFCAAVREYLQTHDPDNLPTKSSKTSAHPSHKLAQEAHEAIRPTDINRLPAELAATLSSDAAQLYDLIWHRAIASQCAPVQLRKTRIISQSGPAFWEARGQVVTVPGYTRYWNNLSADSQLPSVQVGQMLNLKTAQSEQKQTQPPPRYSEPKLVQLMERKGIGRPSTYAPTIKTLKDRAYVQVIKGKLQPTPLGMQLDQALEQLLPELIQPEFTAQMEADLDAIAQGNQEWQTYLTNWHKSYFAPALDRAGRKIGIVLESLSKIPKKPGLLQDNFQEEERQFVPTEDGLKGNRRKSKNSPSKTPKTPRKSTRKSAEASTPKSSTSPSKRSSPATPITRGNQPTYAQAPSTRRDEPPFVQAQAQPQGEPDRPQNGHASPAAIACPKCGSTMTKIPSQSPKLKTDHFLRCSSPACAAVMFWTPRTQTYELPYAERPVDPTKFTNHPCPVCGALLERYSYTKDGKDKVMLRCSIWQNRQEKCKNVAFFQSRDGFWSPSFGLLKPTTPSPEG